MDKWCFKNGTILQSTVILMENMLKGIPFENQELDNHIVFESQ